MKDANPEWPEPKQRNLQINRQLHPGGHASGDAKLQHWLTPTPGCIGVGDHSWGIVRSSLNPTLRATIPPG